ncbi:MAG: AI-2E family transporter [Tannerellaceae bacterium]|jgi:predicted PurR-regulated permease PerM|nr:AI-2E family transporter [Tannerellaceae bacterium]
MSILFNKPFTFDRVARIIFSIAIVALLVYMIALLRNALLPFLVAWLLAYLMQPLVRFFQYRLKLRSRALSIVAVLLFVTIVVGLASWIVIPSVIREADKTMELISSYASDSDNIPFIPKEWQEYIRESIQEGKIMELLGRENLHNAVRELAPRIWSVLSGTFSLVISITMLFIVFLYFVFILLDYEKIAGGWIKLFPDRYRPFLNGLATDVEISMNRYFRGQSLVALCVGILVAAGFRIIGFPLGVTLGLFIGMLNLIPYLQAIGMAPLALLAMIQAAETGRNFWLVIGPPILVLVIVQCIQDLFLVPKIMGRAMRMNPAIILLSLSIWGSLLGFAGLIIALPLTTLTLSYYRRFVLMEDAEEAEKPVEKIKEVLPE